MLEPGEMQQLIDAVCAAPGADDGVPQDEMRRVMHWAYDVRGQAQMLDDILAGRITVRWPEDAAEPHIFRVREMQA